MVTIDTIVAIATPNGESALAILRLSGPMCREICCSAFGRASDPKPRYSYHGSYLSIEGDTLDDVVYCFYEGPRSFTGEDTLEIVCHGNPLIASNILKDLVRRGCRQSDPGEFSRQAFLNGRMDLTQAEAIMELIQARSDKAIKAANNQLRGAFGRQLHTFKERLLATIASIEAYIDFPEEDLPPEQKESHLAGIRELKTYCSRLIDSSQYAAFLRDGVKTLILGEPNVGKSSLLNLLLGCERAIVSEEPGTTRDFLRERIILEAHSIQLLDTAGLREAESNTEKEGIRRTIELVEEADIFLLVEDCSLPSPHLPDAIVDRLSATNCIVIRNKIDLGMNENPISSIDPFRIIGFSATRGDGLEELKTTLVELIDSNYALGDDDLILVNSRHSAALDEIRSCLASAVDKFESDEAIELIASDLRGALEAIGTILGKIDNEAMLDVLFSTFCIGK